MKVAQQWTEQEFVGLDPGDARLDRRAKKLIERLAAKPAASIPEACNGWSETCAAYRFLRNSDEVAVGALSYFQQTGVAVPGQVSVLGYDDTNGTKFTVPRLSSVHIPWTELTENGLNYLLNRCYGLDRPVLRQFPVSVAVRGSLARAPAER